MDRAPHNGSETSIAAARAVSLSDVRETHTRILDTLESYQCEGLTREQLAGLLGLPENTINPRVHELGRLGLVKALANTRRLASGKQGYVFVRAEDVRGRGVSDWPRANGWKQRALKAEAELARVRGGGR